MKPIYLIIMNVLFISIANAQALQSSPLDKARFQSKAWMANADKLKDPASNITIQNTSEAQTFTITGIFIQYLFEADCSTTYFNQTSNTLYGTMWSDNLSLTPSASTPLGAGYLYSMMMNYLFEAANNGGPAATTPGTEAWCIQLGVLQGTPAQYPTYDVGSATSSPSGTLSNL